MSGGKLESVRKILGAVKRSEMARLQAKLNEVAGAREAATDLRRNSARQPLKTTAADMMCQSIHQQRLEEAARALERKAEAAEREAQEMRSTLAITLGREEAARVLAEDAARQHRILAERRAETVPPRGRIYVSSLAGGSSAGME